VLAAAVVAGAAAVPAGAATWNISPTTVNETSQPIEVQQLAIDDGNWLQQPQQSLPGGIDAGDNGNQDTYRFDAPKLDEGADAVVTYAMPDTTEYQAFTQDDVNGGATDELASPTCVDPDPTGPLPAYSCAATFGGQPGTWPWDPSNSTFDTAFHNLRENSSDAPSGYRAASVIAAGQSCNAEMAPGDTVTCTADQPTMDGFSPVDPNNYMILQFINRGAQPTTVTVTNTWATQMLQQYPDGLLYAASTNQNDTLPSVSCTMQVWGDTCALQTWGGANSNAYFATSDKVFHGDWIPQVGNANSDTITIAPASGAASDDEWYGVRVYTQSEIGHSVQDGQSLEDLILAMADSYGETVGTPFLTSRNFPGNGNGNNSVLVAGAALAPGAQLRQGLYRLTMRKDGNLVQDVRVNGLHVPVWQSRTHAPGARLLLDGGGRLAVVARGGRRLWLAAGRGAGAGAALKLHGDGRIVLRTRGGRARFATPTVGYPLPADPGASTLRRGIALQPGGELKAGGSRLRMRTDGNLAFYRGGRLRWSTRTKGNPGSYAHLRQDGRLVVATAHGRVLWSSRGASHRVAVRRDGGLALYGRRNRVVWAVGR
jgi:hypothetical protein